MIAVDASAVLAIVLDEHDAEAMRTAVAAAGRGLISAVNYWEILVRARAEFGDASAEAVENLIAEMNLRVEPADAAQAKRAAAAFARFRGRPGGRLNLGDCFAYALAEREGDGLLFKGEDFPRTDVKPVLAG